jgi:multiple sugar transport system permease protein
VIRRRLPFDPWHLALVPVCALLGLPLVWMFISSFMNQAQLNRFPPTIIPGSLHLDGYRFLFEDAELPTWFVNSTIVSAVVVASNLVFCSTAGYAFARLRFRGSSVMLWLILATLIVPFQLTLIPTFIILQNLGLIDTLWGLVVPSLVLPFGVFLLRQFFLSLPPELEEAAWIDGCGIWSAFWRVTLPLSSPGLAATAVICFILSWNDFFYALILTRTQASTAPVAIVNFIQYTGWEWGRIAAAGTLVMLPVVAFSILVRNYLVGGLAAGGVKE